MIRKACRSASELFARLSATKMPHGVELEKITFAVFALLIIILYASRTKNIYDIPLDKPYFTGAWDEPFAINAGINALNNNLNPRFYNYGGTSVYPFTLIFHVYRRITGINPVYYFLDKPGADPEWPITRKIYPVKPIYVTKAVAVLVFNLMSAVLMLAAAILLAPVIFWPGSLALMSCLDHSTMLEAYASQMMPETHLVLLSGIAAVFFFRSLLEKEAAMKFKWMIACALAASCSVAVKLNAALIVLLPLSLSVNIARSGYLTWKRWLFLLLGFVIPYCVINPAIILAFGDYMKWMHWMLHNSGSVQGKWIERIGEVGVFVKQIYLLVSVPKVLLVAMVLASGCIIAFVDLPAFLGLIIFVVCTFSIQVNMSHNFYPRHLVFLLVPLTLFTLFPIFYVYRKLPKGLRLASALLLLAGTLSVYPFKETARDIRASFSGKFCAEWPRESRDEFMEYVTGSGCTVYFSEYHNFSMPDIGKQLIGFRGINTLPDKLGSNEYIGFILYASSKNEEYNRARDALLKKYKIARVFGAPAGAYDLDERAPIKNPTIYLLK